MRSGKLLNFIVIHYFRKSLHGKLAATKLKTFAVILKSLVRWFHGRVVTICKEWQRSHIQVNRCLQAPIIHVYSLKQCEVETTVKLVRRHLLLQVSIYRPCRRKLCSWVHTMLYIWLVLQNNESLNVSDMDTKDKLKVCGCAIGSYAMYRWINKLILQGCLFPGKSQNVSVISLL